MCTILLLRTCTTVPDEVYNWITDFCSLRSLIVFKVRVNDVSIRICHSQTIQYTMFSLEPAAYVDTKLPTSVQSAPKARNDFVKFANDTYLIVPAFVV